MAPPHAIGETAALPDQTTLISDIKAKAKNQTGTDIPSYAIPAPTYAEAYDTTEDTSYEYDYLLPSFPDIKWEPLTEFEVDPDRGLFGDEKYSRLLSNGATTENVLPTIGTELKGVRLADLTNEQKDDLARLVAHRGVVFVRDQSDFTVEKQLDLGRYWGKLHKHATTGLPKKAGLEEIHLVYADGKRPPRNNQFTQQELWHSDVTYELQPPAYTSFRVITTPPGGGGDTLWVSGYAVYDQLSPAFQQYLEGLSAIHSAHEQAQGAQASGTTVRRDPITTVHPLVRTHPVTGWKSVFVNPGFTRSIVGVPKSESEAVLSFLFKLISQSVDVTVRWKWSKDAVAIWDNRSTVHSATYDFWPEKRHAIRVTPHGERPVFKGGKSRQEDLDEKAGHPKGLRKQVGSKVSGYND
ncbi:hypothetical protein SpCBS45565_g00280 [Spizellomyces sp. 'palustris']|nr:hypothetical protein SpCBS45565_g00280 [Spizellomyces sp. 'palustris']